MAARYRMPRQTASDELHGFHEGPPPPLHRARGPMPPHNIEEELAIRHDEMRRIVADNRFLMEEIVELRSEIPLVKEELHVLSQAIPKLRADKEVETRELIQRGLTLQAELRSLEPLRAEVLQLRAEAQKLEALREEMSSKVQSLTQELKHVQSENQQIPSVRAELAGLRQELARGRTMIEYEKKASSDQMEQRQVMEKNLGSMARELEKLRAELENRARRPAPGSYGMLKPNPEMGLPDAPSDGYGAEKGLYSRCPWPPY
ncbi:protein FLX-like 3 [Typha angustifolia]|uniref:protein FLX-like 3 n=1 Tax=Typha angustifolia TaxID=59011 RepID=UPI003C2E0046